MRERIDFRILVHVFKCLNGLNPEYLAELLTKYSPPRTLRSSDQQLLIKSNTRLKIGERAFHVYGPKLWNNLPSDIRSAMSITAFKRLLKTWYFRQM